MQEEDGKVQNGKEILSEIKAIKDTYVAENTDQVEEEMSFLDRVTKLIQLILNDSSISIYQALDKESLERWKKKRFSRWITNIVTKNIKNTLYFILLATITCFLVSEALSFYAIGDVITAKTWVKAILTEVCFIFLSGYRSKGKLQILWVNFLRGGIFLLMMFVISSQAIDTGTKTISENTAIQQQIEFIQEQIKEKDEQLDYYKKKDWPRNFTRTTIEKEELVKKLIILKDEQAGGKNEEVSQVEKYKMYGRATFRVLLLFISVLITRRIFTF